MSSLRLHLRAIDAREIAITALAAALTAALMLGAGHKLGSTTGLFVPLALVALVAIAMRPLLAVTLAIALPIVCEGEAFGLFTFTDQLYHPLFKRLTPLDGLVMLAVVAVGLDVVRERRPLRFPRELRFPLMLLAFGMVCGVVVSRGTGPGLKSLVLAENLLAYILVLPIAVANLRVGPERLRLLLVGAFALAIVKALLGLAEIASGRGVSITETASHLTYYEPTANWAIMIAILAIFAAVLARMRPPLWMLAGAPLLIASMVLSYRRSFWIATVLGLLLVVLLALSPVGRRLLVPTALFVAAAIWLLGSINFQSQSPIVKRAESLSPTSLTTSVEDRYRLDERANVLANIERKPIAGLGILTPWEAFKRPLPVEHEDAREYVHFAMLWWWMKMGILGLFAYLALLLAAARLSWQVWRTSADAVFKAFGLASLCGVAGLLVAETTATFTGSELRFTVVFAGQVGLLALLADLNRRAAGDQPASSAVSASIE